LDKLKKISAVGVNFRCDINESLHEIEKKVIFAPKQLITPMKLVYTNKALHYRDRA